MSRSSELRKEGSAGGLWAVVRPYSAVFCLARRSPGTNAANVTQVFPVAPVGCICYAYKAQRYSV